jgi:hypothetical protein
MIFLEHITLILIGERGQDKPHLEFHFPGSPIRNRKIKKIKKKQQRS